MVTGRAVQVMGIGQAEARNVYWPGWYKNWVLAGLGQEMDTDLAGTGNGYRPGWDRKCVQYNYKYFR